LQACHENSLQEDIAVNESFNRPDHTATEEHLSTADLAEAGHDEHLERDTVGGTPVEVVQLPHERSDEVDPDRPGMRVPARKVDPPVLTSPTSAAAAAAAPVGEPSDNGTRTEKSGPLFSAAEAARLRQRWDAIQVGFVDEPRKSVEEADSLVATAMKRLAEQFAEERSRLEHEWDRGGDVSTEDLRVALRRYRSFFGRLLNV
jgi:hypothetical protein